MDQNIQKALWLAVSILFFIAVIGIGMIIFNESKESAEQVSEELAEANYNLGNDFNKFNRNNLTGSEVKSAIRTYSGRTGKLLIVVIDKSGVENNYISEGTVNISSRIVSMPLTAKSRIELDDEEKYMNDPTNSLYINPTAKFDGTLAYDNNDELRGIIFTQK
ncbi:MAG: hypothetical protein ACLFMO_01675 [Eubacteriales bacterium]